MVRHLDEARNRSQSRRERSRRVRSRAMTRMRTRTMSIILMMWIRAVVWIICGSFHQIQTTDVYMLCSYLILLYDVILEIHYEIYYMILIFVIVGRFEMWYL